MQLICKLLENIVCSGWEILTASEFTNTPGFELATWVLKKSTTPISEAAVAAVVFNDQEGKVEVIANSPQIQVCLVI